MRRGAMDISYSLYKAIRGDGLYPGEKHALLILPDGTFTRGNFIGPGTKIIKRIKS